MTLVLVTGPAALLLFLVAVSSVRIHFRYERSGADDHLTISITWLRYLTHTVSVPRADLARRQRKPGLEIGAEKTRLRFAPLDMLRPALRHLGRLRRAVGYAAARTRIKKLEWSSEFGLADAAYTGVAGGLIWSLKGTMLTAVSAHTRLETTPRIRVRPNYQKALFHTLLNCIFEIRIGHIMIAGLKAVRPG